LPCGIENIRYRRSRSGIIQCPLSRFLHHINSLHKFQRCDGLFPWTLVNITERHCYKC
jgi:hypothetical protein